MPDESRPPQPDYASIEALQRQAAARTDALAFSGGLPAATLFPQAQLTELTARTLGRHGEKVLQYGWPEGDAPLRQWLAARLRLRGAAVTADAVMITSGAQQAINLAAELLGKRCGAVGLDAVTYPGAISAFERHQARLVPRDHPGACFLYLMPGMHNPLGMVMRAGERRQVVETGLTLIEDDAYAELTFGVRPAPSLLAMAADRVWHIGTFSKTICPGLRLGWLIVPPHYHQELLTLKGASDIQSNGLAQAVLSEFLPRDDYDTRLERARAYYSDQAERLMSALRRYLPEWRYAEPAGGFSLWVATPATGPAVGFLAAALRYGAAFDPGELFEPFGAEAMTLRLSYSNMPPERIEEGVRRLAEAWREYCRLEHVA